MWSNQGLGGLERCAKAVAVTLPAWTLQGRDVDTDAARVADSLGIELDQHYDHLRARYAS